MRTADNCGTVQQLLAIWRLSRFDPYVFLQIRPGLMELGTEAGMEAVPEERAQALELYRKEGDTSPPSHVFFTKK